MFQIQYIISFIRENLSDQGLILLVIFKPRNKEKNVFDKSEYHSR